MTTFPDINLNAQRKTDVLFLDFLLYFFCCFPFLYFLPFPSDIQPYAMVVAVFYLIFTNTIVIPRYFVLCLGMFIVVIAMFFGTILFVQDTSILMLFRKAYNYLNVMVVPVAVFNSLLKTKGIVEKWIKGFILVWLFVGVVQAVVFPEFLSGIVANFRTSITRGVPSLASEPSFYGYMMVFMSVIASRFKRKKDRLIYISICVFQVIFLGESAVAIIYLAIFGCMAALKWLLVEFKTSPFRFIKALMIALVIGVVFFYVVRGFVENNGNSRLVSVLKKIIFNFDSLKTLRDVYRLDASVGYRVDAIVTSIRGTFDNRCLPHGFIYSDFTDRITSGYGSVMYELGFIGIYFIVILTGTFIKGFDNSVPIVLGITAMMFSAVQLASPLFAFLLGYAAYNSRGKGKENELIVFCRK